MRLNKHNKKRNTLFLYEVLIRELTRSILEGNKKSKDKITSILKKYFSKNKPLAKEIELYKILLNTNGLKEKVARNLLNEVARVYHNFNTKEITKEQEEVVSQMSKEVNKDVFMTYIPNYRNLATIYQLFNRKLNPKEKVLLEEKIIESLISQKLEEKKDEFKAISNFEFKTFVKSFNETYSGELLEEQQDLLSRYVLSCVDNGIELRIYLNEEIGRLKEVISTSMLQENTIKNDVEMTQKTNEVLMILESFKNESQISPNLLEQLLRIQQLAQEIKEN